MAFDTADRIYPAVDFMLADVIATVRKVAFRGIGELVARFDFFLVGVAVAAE